MIILFSLFLVIWFGGICEGIMDKIQFHYSTSIFSTFKNTTYWNPEESWKNKYKNGNPLEGEKFFLSTTFFVSLTDAWHFFKLLRNAFVFASLVFIGYMSDTFMCTIIYVISARTLYGFGFWLSYGKLLTKK